MAESELEHPLGDEGLAEDQGVVAIDLEDADSRPADRGAADQPGTFVTEVMTPVMTAGMKELGQLAGVRVETGNVRALEAVAVPAGEGEI